MTEATAMAAPDDAETDLVVRAHARIRLLPLRIGYALTAAMLTAVLAGPGWGAAVLIPYVLGEAIDMGCAALILRGERGGAAPRAGSALGFLGALLWALGAACAVAAIWLGGGQAMRVLALAFLAAASVGAHAARPAGPVASWAAQAVFLVTLGALFGLDYLRDPERLRDLVLVMLAGLVFAATLGAVFVRWHLQDERDAAAAAELRAALTRQEASNAALRVTRADLTRREAEAQELARKVEAASRAKSEFLAVISHEIRTPMSAILGMVELMRDRARDGEDGANLDTIEQAARALLSIFDDLLDFSKIEAGQMEFNAHRFAPADLVHDIARMFRPIQEAKGLDFQTSGLDALPEALMGDAGRIRQIMTNLVGNAMKFTEKGGVRVEAGYVAEDYTAELRFDVVDTGPGILPEEIERIFAPFEQIESGMRRENGGTGLGLAISRRLAESMGGALEVESTPGKGSRFILKLPLIEAPAEDAALSTEGFGSVAPNLAGTRILVAEDNATNRLILDRFLAPTGATLSVAEDGGAAVRLYANGAPDLVLMDMSMPIKSGLDATRDIRVLEAREGRRRCPIVALTANAFSDDRAACMEAGMDGFLAKPVKRGELFAACQAALEGGLAPAEQGAADRGAA